MMITQHLFRLSAYGIAYALLATSLACGQDAATDSTHKEQELLAVLRSDALPSEKALACKGLAVHGSIEAVPDLAKLLPDEKLSSWARTALEAIPGEEPSGALREAAESLDGKLRVGMINSIGVIRDAQAVDLLAKHLQGPDAAAASAAAIALGRIGNETATASLLQALAATDGDVRSAVAEGCVLCAEGLHGQGNMKEAVAVYDRVRNSEVPKPRILEATRGAILARQEQGATLLLETLRSPDKQLFQLALGVIREFPGSELDRALAAELSSATPSRAALLVQAISDRPADVNLAAVMQAAQQGDRLVRLSAIDALRRMGDASCVAGLLEVASDADAELAGAAEGSLAELAGKDVDQQLVSVLSTADGELQPLLLRLVGRRRMDAFKLATNALDHASPDVRKSALYALGETVDLDGLSVLISQVTDAQPTTDKVEAERALRVASIRMPDPDLCTAKLVAAMEQSPSSKSLILEIVSEVGGSAALETLAEAAKSDNPEHQDIASRLLGKWNNLEAASVLLDLAQKAPAEKYRIRALRGYIGMARKFPMPEQRRVQMCKKAWDASTRIAEKQLILDVLSIHPSKPALNLANQAKQIAELEQQATAAADAIKAKLRN